MPGRLLYLFLVVSALLSLYQAAVSATPQEAAVLAQLKDIWSRANNKVSRWTDSVDACNGPWPGITCALKDDVTLPKPCFISNASCKVTALDLSYSNLTGMIPFILGGMSNLLSLDLHGNHLIGGVSTRLFDGFPNMTRLDFSDNYFNDTLPSIAKNNKMRIQNWSTNCFSDSGACRLLPLMRSLSDCQTTTSMSLPACPSWVRQHPILLYILVGVIPFTVILCSFAIVTFFCWRSKKKQPKKQAVVTTTASTKRLSVECKVFTYQELEEATNKFHDNRLLGCGGSGSVYQGRFSNGSCMAIKHLVKPAGDGGMEVDFWKEVQVLGSLRHPNVVPLRGYCRETRGGGGGGGGGIKERLLVYEYMPNGSVLDALLSEDVGLLLPWSRRFSVAMATACALEYLHEHCCPRVVHKDVKPSNILLDRNFVARVGDFGLGKGGLFVEREQQQLQQEVCLDLFVDPDFVLTGKLTEKSDIFSFGMLLLVLIQGRQVLETQCKGQVFSSIQVLAKAEDPRELVDVGVGGEFDRRQVTLCAQVALLCTRILPDLRPTMGEVRRMLDGTAPLPLTLASLINSPASSSSPSRRSFVSEGPTPTPSINGSSSCYGLGGGGSG